MKDLKFKVLTDAIEKPKSVDEILRLIKIPTKISSGYDPYLACIYLLQWLHNELGLSQEHFQILSK